MEISAPGPHQPGRNNTSQVQLQTRRSLSWDEDRKVLRTAGGFFDSDQGETPAAGEDFLTKRSNLHLRNLWSSCETYDLKYPGCFDRMLWLWYFRAMGLIDLLEQTFLGRFHLDWKPECGFTSQANDHLYRVSSCEWFKIETDKPSADC